MSGISKSQVSRLCEEIDVRVKAFLDRPIEGDWPYVWIDATYLKVRQNGRIVSVAVTIAVGVNSDGRREVLGMAIGASEAETFWTDFLRSLARRGLRGVKLIISDAHEGIKASVSRVFSAAWQRCRVHFSRNAHGRGHGNAALGGVAAEDIASEQAEALACCVLAVTRHRHFRRHQRGIVTHLEVALGKVDGEGWLFGGHGRASQQVEPEHQGKEQWLHKISIGLSTPLSAP
jgi:hypothetical protein